MGHRGETQIDREMRQHHFRVAIFGSARIKKGDKVYGRVYDLARMIGFEGMDVITGGGPGLMEAGMDGHYEGKKEGKHPESHEIGLQIRLPHEQRDAHHIDIREEFEQFSPRLATFVKLAHCVVVTPGGVGTILELFYTWQLIQVGHKHRMPIILMGGMWKDLVAWIRRWPLEYGNLNPEDVDLLIPVSGPEEAMEVIRAERAKWDRK